VPSRSQHERALRAGAWLALVGVAASLAAGCGGSGSSGKPRLTVSAAASLKGAFERYGRDFPDAQVRFSFGGSDELAAQIRQGVKPDLYAAANVKLSAQLFSEGLLEKPVPFARNRLVIAVPAGSSRVRALSDLARNGVKLVVGAPSVPIGSYTRALLERLPRVQRERILANVRSQEPDVTGVVGKLTEGAADAGFVYATDVIASGGRLDAIELPKRLRGRVAYAVGILPGIEHEQLARAFVSGLLSGRGRAALLEAGFEPPR